MFWIFSMAIYILFFCFKQKTAYELRISDWSSDVCSSDLLYRQSGIEPALTKFREGAFSGSDRQAMAHGPRGADIDPSIKKYIRSEEHTSELQSLMRISYAVFCLKKKQYK